MNTPPLPWKPSRCKVTGEQLDVWRLPGVLEAGEATLALTRAARHLNGARVLVAGAGIAGTALWATRQGAQVTCWTDSRADGLSVEATFRANRLSPPELYVTADFAWATPASFDAVLLHLPRGTELQDELLQLSHAALRPAGQCYAVGSTREGVRSALHTAQLRFGQAGVVVRKGGFHVIMAVRGQDETPIPEVAWQSHAVTVDGKPAILISAPGVFAAGRLDEGAAALIAGMHVLSGQRVLELGCGTGLVALAALRRGAQVTAVDVSARAVEATRRTLRANGFAQAEVLLSYGAERITSGHFDVVLANPPFHTGYDVDFEVARLFIADAARSLHAGGQLFLVANAFLPYETWLGEVFNTAEVVYHDGRFRVWCAGR